MADFVLWRRLTQSDFRAMKGAASPGGRGGGARHIALGRQSSQLDIDKFLLAKGRAQVTIKARAASGSRDIADIKFRGNPGRRNGEWIIQDQRSNRHPAWSASAGFPALYVSGDPPFVFIFRIGRRFYAQFKLQSELSALPPSPGVRRILAASSGVAAIAHELLGRLSVQSRTLFEAFEAQKGDKQDEFDPASVEDGRRRIFAAVYRRQGQPAFRARLLAAYNGRCAITGCRIISILEAAHISPYRGGATNVTSNGILLRADIHTLFDVGLISIDPSTREVRISGSIVDPVYTSLAGRKVTQPANVADRPSKAALREHDGLSSLITSDSASKAAPYPKRSSKRV